MNEIIKRITIRALHENDGVPYGLLLTADPSADNIKGYLKQGECNVAVLDDRIVGAYVLLQTRPETMEIMNIAVDAACQGKGIGRLLIQNAMELAKVRGAKTLEIGTGNSSLYQLGLYQKCGFRITGIERDFFIKHYTEEIWENGIKCIDMIRLSMDL